MEVVEAVLVVVFVGAMLPDGATVLLKLTAGTLAVTLK